MFTFLFTNSKPLLVQGWRFFSPKGVSELEVRGKNTLNDEYTMSPYHSWYPIPVSAINANTQGQINQNLGYRRRLDSLVCLK